MTPAGMVAANAATAVLPPRSAAVAMKTLALTSMAGAQTINNQQSTKSSDSNDGGTATIKATMMTMETKATLGAR